MQHPCYEHSSTFSVVFFAIKCITSTLKKRKRKEPQTFAIIFLARRHVLHDSTLCKDRDPVGAVVFDAQPVISAWDRGGLTKHDSAIRL